MLESTTTLIETATVAGATAVTGKTAVKIDEKENGEKDLLINKKRALIGTSLSSTASSATYGIQEASFNNTINKINNAQAYVQSMSDADLERTLVELDLLEASNNIEKNNIK